MISGINYKTLVSKSENIMNQLRPYLNSNEAVSNCVKFTRSLPKNLKTDFSIETIYYEFSITQFNSMVSWNAEIFDLKLIYTRSISIKLRYKVDQNIGCFSLAFRSCPSKRGSDRGVGN